MIISSLICRAQKQINDKMMAVNNILKRVCKLNGLEFIDNSNIYAENLFEDDLHLTMMVRYFELLILYVLSKFDL